MSNSTPGPGSAVPGDDLTSGISAEARARVSEALRASFQRLAPQGSDEWNFLASFTHLGDRYGPYRPGGTSELADQVTDQGAASRRRGRRGRLIAGKEAPDTDQEKSELEVAMGQVVEAFRFLHARVNTIEARLGTEDMPLDGAAWLAPARELAGWVDPVASYVADRTTGGDVVHADCGEGALLHALTQSGLPASGVEPRGAVALRALESGCDVAISEASECLARRPTASLGGLVLSGVVDRLPLHAILALLADSRRVLTPGAPFVVVAEPVDPGATTDVLLANDVVDRAALHLQTWELLLDRNGFVSITPMPPGSGGDDRFAVSAAVPTP